ncbi:MAG: peptide chain release factor 1 [Firmicutes bacterium]|nr:peptide chain release factor 1 [Bacillota bacterium]
MTQRLLELENKYEELSLRLSEPNAASDPKSFSALMKEHSNLMPIVEKFRELKAAEKSVSEALELLESESDEEFRAMLKEELGAGKEDVERLKTELTRLLLPKDPNDEKNVIVEIRGGAGGDEAALFAADLFRMYSRYAERRRWKTEILYLNENDLGGFKEVSFMIRGKGAYSRLKYESGVHRVQRVPETESGGRIHTSTVTVAVLAEAEEVEVNLDMNDVRIDVFRASGNGGQCVNTTDSAVRVTHIPTGIVVSCQNEKSQIKNKAQALTVLYARILELERERAASEIAADRRSQVGTGNRNERIRTYNFPQGRLTDHRINLTLYKLLSVLDGDLDEVMDALITTAEAEKLSSAEV